MSEESIQHLYGERASILNAHHERVKNNLIGRRQVPVQEGAPYATAARTDAQDLIEAPSEVILGYGEDARVFLLYPKSHMEADEWRVAALAFLNELAPTIRKENQNLGSFMVSAEAMLEYANLFVVAHIPAIAELVFLWEPSLPRERILFELRATDNQMAKAFLACLRLAFPFFGPLQEIFGLLKQGNPQIQPETKETPEQSPKT